LQPSDFARVQLHRNNSFYRFLLNICELAFRCLLADESSVKNSQAPDLL
jgi:5-methylcytosine-specific restriction enzyme subunit McrC